MPTLGVFASLTIRSGGEREILMRENATTHSEESEEGEPLMPSQVRIISPKNSAEWDHLVRNLITSGKLGQEQTYGGCPSEERADHVRRKIRTAAKKQDVASRVFWKPCPTPGKCSFGPDCTHHVYITLFDLEQGRQYKLRQAEQTRRS